jgi:hypothetical protein
VIKDHFQARDHWHEVLALCCFWLTESMVHTGSGDPQFFALVTSRAQTFFKELFKWDSEEFEISEEGSPLPAELQCHQGSSSHDTFSHLVDNLADLTIEVLMPISEQMALGWAWYLRCPSCGLLGCIVATLRDSGSDAFGQFQTELAACDASVHLGGHRSEQRGFR